jgi:mycothiol S-conjugate amidase
VAEGVEVVVVTCTGGERGSVLNKKMDRPEVLANISEIRRDEMEQARKILGVRQEWLGFVDSGLPEGDPKPPLPEGCFGLVDPQVGAEPLVRLIRSFRPHVITTYDEKGGYPHPDHIMCHNVSVVAFDAAGDPDRYPDTGEPWQPLKLYYNMGFSRERVLTIHQAMLAAGLESPYVEWIKDWESKNEEDETAKRVTTRVPCADYFPVRDEALRAHATQVDPDGWWFKVPQAIQQAAWPTEDFELARSLVDTVMPEDDLFAGVRETLECPESVSGC